MLRVLMFGWEFPPHISGGLGTACHGLTHALVRQGVQITFVVPRLTGDESDKGPKLLDASKVKFSKSAAPGRRRTRATDSVINNEEYRVGDSIISVIEVPSQLSAYNLAHLSRPVFKEEDWKQSILEARDPLTMNQQRPGQGSSYAFTGGYGDQLIREVGKYAEVAREIARSTKFDVIHAHDWMTFPAGIAAKEVSGKPLVLHVHATEHDRAGTGGSPYVYAIEQEGLKKCDKAISVSNWTRNILSTRYMATPSTLEVVHNGIMRGPTENTQGTHPLAKNLVTFLGRVTYQKGPEYFVEAAQKTLKWFPDTHFVMAGSGDALPKIIRSVASKGMSRSFHFTGFLKKPDINRLLALTKVYVMPSVSEPFGITPLEAIQAGVPVIISKQSGVSEVMPHALKVDYWDTDSLSQAMCSVLRHKSLSNTLKSHSAETIGSISWEAAAKKIKQIYYETIRKN